MNKLNILLLIIIGIGLICGCRYELGDGGNNSSTRNRRTENSRSSEKTAATNKKQSKEISSDDSPVDKTGDSRDSRNDEDSDESSVSNEDDSSSSTGGDTASLEGKWVWARTGSGTYTTGGSYAGSNGSRFTYEFSEDGEVEFTGIMNVMQGGCRMQIFTTKKGEAALSGDTLTINWEPAEFSRGDACDSAGNYKKTLPAETETNRVAFKNSGGQKQLCLTDKEETCFSPAN